MDMTEPAEIVIASVKAIDAVRLNRQSDFCGVQFVAFGVRDDDKSRDIAVVVQHAMQFERALERGELCPGKQRQAKLYHGGVDAVELVLEMETMFWRKGYATLEQGIEKTFEDGTGTAGVGVGEGGFSDRLRKPKMVKLFGMGTEAALNGAQTVLAAGLGVEEHDKLLPCAEMLYIAVAGNGGDGFFKIMSSQEI